MSNPQLITLLVQKEKDLTRIINSGSGKESIISEILQAIPPDQKEKVARKYLSRIQSQKFRKAWNESILADYQTIYRIEDNPAPSNISDQTDEYCFEQKIFVKRADLVLNGALISKKRQWTTCLYDSLKESDIQCPLAIKKGYLTTQTLTVYAECRHEACHGKYSLFCSDSNSDLLSFSVTANIKPFDMKFHPKILYRYISGNKRSQLGNEVIEHGAKNIQSKMVRIEDMSSVNYRNEKTVASMETLRQMAHEKRLFSRFDKDEEMDIKLLKLYADQLEPSENDPTPGFIRMIRTDTFLVSWGCNTQMNIYSKSSDGVLYFDATGNISRSKSSAGKRQFYYSLVFRESQTYEIMPLLEFISDQHDIASISAVLQTYCGEMKKELNSQTPVKAIVTDFSFAVLNAATIAFNGCNLYLYLESLHRVYVQNDPLPYTLTVLAICSTHVLKFFTDKIKSMENKMIIKDLFICVLMADNYDLFLDLFSRLYAMLHCKKLPRNFVFYLLIEFIYISLRYPITILA